VAITKLDETAKELKVVTDYNTLQAKLGIDPHFDKIKKFLMSSWENEDLRIFPVINYVSGDFSGKKPWLENTGFNALVYFLNQQKKATTTGTIQYPKDDPVDYFAGETAVPVPFSKK
jgi:hypothetical protein